MANEQGVWVAAEWDEVPISFSDSRVSDFRTVCTNGFVGDLSIGSAFMHNPSRWPQCFPEGVDSGCSCTIRLEKRVHDNDKLAEPGQALA